MSDKVTMKTTDAGTLLFETEVPATLYRRGNPKKCTNIDCAATLQCYARPGEEVIGIWAEGIHIRVNASDIVGLLTDALKMVKGFSHDEGGVKQ